MNILTHNNKVLVANNHAFASPDGEGVIEANGSVLTLNGSFLSYTAAVTYYPIIPSDLASYPLTRNGSYGATDGTSYGYYNPTTEAFTAEAGMTGDLMQRCQFVSFDQTQYIDTGIDLTGSDTVTIDMMATKSGINVFGSWHSNNANVYTLYASSSSSYVRYNSSLYRNTPIALNTRLTFKMTPTGDYVGSTRYHTWAQGSFDTETPCLVGWLNGSGSPKFAGNVYDFAINGKCHLIPVKAGTKYYLFDILQWSLPTHTGNLSGGAVVDDPIPFPT